MIIFNILIVFFVLLIAYWWANQGAFSAIIHLACVIVAGAIAFAFWEPLTMGLLLRGGWFDSYAWGVSLVGLFAIVLLILRLVTNKVVPANVDLPHGANLALGGAVGAVSGVLSVGILMLGLGWIQSERSLMGYVGWGRSERDGQVKYLGPNLWLPAHRWTDEFFSFASVNALSTGRPLRHYSPNLYQMSASLVRDSAKEGRGQVSMPPDAVRVLAVYVCPRQVVLKVRFDRLARDFGDQLTLSASQLRLIAQPTSPRAKPYVSFPVRWTQDTADGPGFFQFDDVSHYVTSVPGRESAEATLLFPFPDGAVPRFLQVKGTRVALPQYVAMIDCSAALGPQAAAAVTPTAAVPTGGANIQNAIQVTKKLIRLTLNSNNMPGGLEHVDLHLTEGDAIVTPSRSFVSRALRIQGIYEPRNTKIVQVDVSRTTSPADIFGAIRQQVDAGARPMLVDQRGNTYSPIGFIHERPGKVRIKLDPGRGVGSIGDLPKLPSSGKQTLKLVFRVTEGITLVAFKVGDLTVGTCNVTVDATAGRRGGNDNQRAFSSG